MKTFTIAFGLATTFACSALAADLGTPQVRSRPVVAAVAAPAGFDWTGLYVGAHIGYGANTVTYFDSRPRTATYAHKINGLLAGGHLGYNWQFGSNLVVGVETDFTYSGVKRRTVNFIGTTSDLTSRLDWLGSTRARLGYSFGNFLPYIAGGVAYGKLSHNVDFVNEPQFSHGKSAVHVGWTAGAGFDYAIDRNWSVRMEYRYTDLGSHNYAEKTDNVTVPQDTSSNARSSMHDVRAGISYRF